MRFRLKDLQRNFLIFLFVSQISLSGLAGTSEKNDLWFFVLVKSSNYSQAQDGKLTLLNYHFFSELFAKESGLIKSAALRRKDNDSVPFVYVDRGDTFYYEGGHFKTVEAVDDAHPNGQYQFKIELSSGQQINADLSLSGPGGKTDIPAPIRISFFQNGKQKVPENIEPTLPLTVRWTPYSNGREDPNGIVDDMIFVVFQDCHGERVFHTGLPFKESNYMTYREKEVIVPAGHFGSGQTYSMFVELPHVVDSTMVGVTPGFTSYATATYTDIKTLGPSSVECPKAIPPLDTGQTDRMEVELH